jgi:AAA domain
MPVDWKQAFAVQPEEIRWLIDPLIERGRVCALFGAPDSHKSLLTLDLVLRQIVRAGMTAVYIDQENHLTDLVARLTAFGANPDELDRLRLYSFPDLPPLDTQQGGRHLRALAVANAADLVVLDTTGRMIAGKENDADTFFALYNWALKPLKAMDIASLRIDHPGKDAAKGQRGSSAKDGDADVVWWMQKLSETMFRLDKRRDRTNHAPDRVELELRQAPVRHEIVTDAAGRSGTDLLIKALDEAGIRSGASRTDTRDALRKLGLRAGNDQLSIVLRTRQARSDDLGDRRGPVGEPQRSSGPSPGPPYTGDRGPETGPDPGALGAVRLLADKLGAQVISEIRPEPDYLPRSEPREEQQ